eukprot:scaffold72080_cov18-Tisochrysis_lutea.AAC.1
MQGGGCFEEACCQGAAAEGVGAGSKRGAPDLTDLSLFLKHTFPTAMHCTPNLSIHACDHHTGHKTNLSMHAVTTQGTRQIYQGMRSPHRAQDMHSSAVCAVLTF